jgi:molybdopterin molybdotransferase
MPLEISMPLKNFEQPVEAIEALASHLRIVSTECVTPCEGRVLADAVIADRDSPSADVSAMDGYAIRLADAPHPQLPISGEAQPGQPPLTLQDGTAIRIFTGAVIPVGAEAVVMREHTDESTPGLMRWLDTRPRVDRGLNIRFQGENTKAGASILEPGSVLSPASLAATSSFGLSQAMLYRRVRVAIIVTGNELLSIESTPLPWQLRDSNGPTIASACRRHPWIDCQSPTRCRDDAGALKEHLHEQLRNHDAVILTGGVSKGDYDHVPGVISGLGATTVFHRLPIRPGRPILGAATDQGQLILGLPGNPVSALVGMVRFGVPLLARQAGLRQWEPTASSVAIQGPNDKTLPLHWYRLVRLLSPGVVKLSDLKGSGDLVALSQSDGFIHQPPNLTGAGPWSFYSW